MTRKADIESCQDFMGTTLVVGDHVARTINGEMILSQIKRIRTKSTTRWDHSLCTLVPAETFVVCELKNVSHISRTASVIVVKPENLVKVEENTVMMWKLQAQDVKKI